MNAYSAVSIYATTGSRLKRFLHKHKKDYPTITSFCDYAVNNIIDRVEAEDKNAQAVVDESMKDAPALQELPVQIVDPEHFQPVQEGEVAPDPFEPQGDDTQ